MENNFEQLFTDWATKYKELTEVEKIFESERRSGREVKEMYGQVRALRQASDVMLKTALQALREHSAGRSGQSSSTGASRPHTSHLGGGSSSRARSAQP